MLIAASSPTQAAAIRAVHLGAFNGSEEANLVERLQSEGHSLLSLVATLDGAVVGHILFSRIWIRGRASLYSAVALAPVAVHPAHQRKGIGSKLISSGIEAMRRRGERIILVVGHPDYYPKFGFKAEKTAPSKALFRRMSSWPWNWFPAHSTWLAARSSIRHPSESDPQQKKGRSFDLPTKRD